MSKSRVEVFHNRMAENWNGLPDKSVYYLEDFMPQIAQGTQELLISQGHPYRLLGKGTGDIGGPLLIVRREYEESSPYVFNRSVNNDTNPFASNILTNYYAWQSEYISDIDFPDPLFTDQSDLNAKGTTAIANIIPTNPLSGVVVTLGELKSEGIPSLIGVNSWKQRTFNARSAGSEYLNYQFGWLPLVSEIQTFAQTTLQHDDIVEKYVAESGKLLHRRYTYPISITESETEEDGVYPSPTQQGSHWSASGKRTKKTTVRSETWFEGAFTYHLPPPGTRERDAAIARKLYGVELTPDVVWSLTPWSWAVDWISNAGDVMSNISRFSQDGLVMPYAYIMEKVTHSVEYILSGARTKYEDRSVECRQKFTTTVKQRHKATPWGFGLDPALDFSDRQWSILVALGLSRGSNGMKYE